MANILIENYRGFKIEFNTDKSTFSSVLNDYNKESKSFDAIKKDIDEYLKENQSFEPFMAIRKPDLTWGSETIEIIGIRKDGLFYYKNEKGEKNQLSKHSENSYFIKEDWHEKVLVEIAYKKTLVDDAEKSLKESIKKITGTPITEIKKRYMK